MKILPKDDFDGEIVVPGDKSISHRAVILGAVAEGVTEISGFLDGEDNLATVACLRQMGVEIDVFGDFVRVHGVGLGGLRPPAGVLNCGNSATTMRLLAGLLAGQSFNAILDGDASLRTRPMGRIIEPLSLMGAEISAATGGTAPLQIFGKKLKNINYKMPLHSAQVKSALMLAALYAEGDTTIEEMSCGLTRNHTEEMLAAMGAKISTHGSKITISPSQLAARKIDVPGDFSSAAFFIVLALLISREGVTIKNVGLNPTRTGLLGVLKEMGGHIEISGSGDVFAKKSQLKALNIGGEQIPKMIDEIPILAVAAAFAQGVTTIENAGELAHKETDRLAAMATELAKMGVKIKATPDGLKITGGKPLSGATLNSHGDHRVAMSLAIAATAATSPSHLHGTSCVNISFPNFFKILK